MAEKLSSNFAIDPSLVRRVRSAVFSLPDDPWAVSTENR